MPQNLTYDESPVVQVMHRYGVTRPQWAEWQHLFKGSLNINKNDVWNAEIPSAALRSVYSANSKYIEAECSPHQIEVKKKQKKNLFNLVISLMKFQTTNTYVAARNVAVWNSHFVKQSSDLKTAQYLSDVTGSPTVNGGLSLVAVLLITNVHGSVASPV